MNKVIVAAVALIFVGAAVWALTNDNSQQSSTSEQQATTQADPQVQTPGDDEAVVTVSYDGKNFSPEPITVEAGTTVEWKNDSSRPMWVASDVHPTHEKLPEFDAKQGVMPGSSYKFKFTKTGTWQYHDHLNPSATGTVVVN